MTARYFKHTQGFSDGTLTVAFVEGDGEYYGLAIGKLGHLKTYPLGIDYAEELVSREIWREVFFDGLGNEIDPPEPELTIDDKFDLLSEHGASIVSFNYEGSDKPNKNVTVGINDLEVPWMGAVIVNNIRFAYQGQSYIIGKDNNDDHQVKIFKTDKISGLKCRKL